MRNHGKIAFVLLLALALPLSAQAPPKPKLVLFIAVDQFRADYLQRFRDEYRDGFDLLLRKGAVFVDALLDHIPTVTAAGHSTFLTGATPSVTGIIDNAWYDRESGKDVTSVSDESVTILGGSDGISSSPHRLLVSTVGDELKVADHGQSRVIGISLKDRAAILPAGRMADGAFWFDSQSGSFISSTYYFRDLPTWAKKFNAGKPADRYTNAEWMGKRLPPDAGEKLYAMLEASPFGNEMTEDFAEKAIQAEQLGGRAVSDLLSISFSSNDIVGHTYGPDSPQVRDMCVRTDRLLGKLLKFVDGQVGLKNVLVVFSADHGVVSIPEVNVGRKMPGGRVPYTVVRDAVQKALTGEYGDGKWIVGETEFTLYLNRELMREKRLQSADVERTAAQALLALPHVFRVYTRSELLNAGTGDPVARRVQNGFNVRRSGDVWVLLEPYWILGRLGTNHGSPFYYDTHVPLIFMGSGIRAGSFYNTVAINDIAPTLAAILGVEVPSGSIGRILSEIFLTSETQRTFKPAQ